MEAGFAFGIEAGDPAMCTLAGHAHRTRNVR
jgi:hypothetical protein